jgi:hypothetical protein
VRLLATQRAADPYAAVVEVELRVPDDYTAVQSVKLDRINAFQTLPDRGTSYSRGVGQRVDEVAVLFFVKWCP